MKNGGGQKWPSLFVPRGTIHDTVFRLIFRRRRVFVLRTIKYMSKTEKRVLGRLNGEFRNRCATDKSKIMCYV